MRIAYYNGAMWVVFNYPESPRITTIAYPDSAPSAPNGYPFIKRDWYKQGR